MRLPTLVPPGKKSSYLSAVSEINLPRNVEAAFVHLFTLSSSLTCVVIRFEIKDEYSGEYDDAIRKRYETKLEPLKNGWRHVHPRSQKERRISQIRDSIRNDIAAWFKINLPGTFSESRSIEHFPTCEMIAFNSSKKLGSRVETAFPHEVYQELLNVEPRANSWVSLVDPCMVFAWPNYWRQEPKYHSIYSVNLIELESVNTSMYFGNGKKKFLNYFDNKLEELVWRWSCLALVDVFQAKFNSIRDSSFSLNSKSDARLLLKELREVIKDSFDVNSFSPDFLEGYKNFGRHFRTQQFVESRGRPNEVVYELDKMLNNEVARRSRRLSNADKILRDFLLKQSELASTLENVKVQRQMRYLTVAVLILSLATIVEPTKKFYQNLVGNPAHQSVRIPPGATAQKN